MPHVADWLQRLGLGQYAQRFVENDINFSILPDLTDQDLKELGVASLGHRRQLLRAIAQLRGGENSAKETAAEPPTPLTAPIGAERRQVTVMFSDLVGSTALSPRMDPADCEITRPQESATRRYYFGALAQSPIDGFLASFGTRGGMKMTPNERFGPR